MCIYGGTQKTQDQDEYLSFNSCLPISQFQCSTVPWFVHLPYFIISFYIPVSIYSQLLTWFISLILSSLLHACIDLFLVINLVHLPYFIISFYIPVSIYSQLLTWFISLILSSLFIFLYRSIPSYKPGSSTLFYHLFYIPVSIYSQL